MCDFVNTTFCRLCLNITEGEGQQTADLAGDKELCTILENVFPEIKLDLIPTPKVCLTCKDKLQFTYNFKNTVLSNQQKIESNKDLFINAIDTCRLCLKEKLGKDVVYLCENNHQWIRTVTEIAIAPLNFDSLKKPVMCTECWSSVKNTHGFKKRCLDNEEKLRNLSKNSNNGVNSLSTEEVLTAILRKEKALIHISDKENKTLNTHSESQSLVNLDSDNKDIVFEDMKQFLPYSTNKDAVSISDSYYDIDLTDSKKKNEHSDSECSDDLFAEEINDNVVEIRIKKPKNVGDTKLINIDSKKRDFVVDGEQSENHRFLGLKVKEEIVVKDEMSFEEHNIDGQCFSFEDESKSSIRKSLVAPSEHYDVKLETTDHGTLSVPSNKMIKLEKSLTIHLIDCVKYQSHLKMTKITTENEDDSHPHSLKKPSKTTQQIFNRSILQHTKKEKCDDIQLGDNINLNETTECDQNKSEAAEPPSDLKETSLEALKKLVYQCRNCSYKTALYSKYVLHLKKVHRKKFICDICQRGYKESGALESHRLTHCKDTKFVCDVCQKQFRKKDLLSSHLRSHRTDKNYLCDICGIALKSYPGIKVHRLTHCEEKKFVCDVCQKRFKIKQQLIRHQITHRTDRNYICDICEKAFKANIYLTRHRLIVHYCEDKKFTCDLCQKGCKTKGDLRKHQMTHRTDRNYICDICEKAFKTNKCLKLHRAIHRQDKKFVCNICHKAFKREDYLRNHQVFHLTDRNYICDMCEKAFKTSHALKIHQLAHYEEKKFVCDVCQKRFRTKQLLNLHKDLHDDSLNLPCHICQKVFKTEKSLKKHLRVHCEVENYICRICQKGFKYQDCLTIHMKTHCSAKNFVCYHCQKSFKTKQSIKEHMIVHRTDKNCTCDICKKAFKSNRHLRKHRLSHCEDRNFVCDVCHKGFKKNAVLRAHKKIHYNV